MHDDISPGGYDAGIDPAAEMVVAPLTSLLEAVNSVNKAYLLPAYGAVADDLIKKNL